MEKPVIKYKTDFNWRLGALKEGKFSEAEDYLIPVASLEYKNGQIETSIKLILNENQLNFQIQLGDKFAQPEFVKVKSFQEIGVNFDNSGFRSNLLTYMTRTLISNHFEELSQNPEVIKDLLKHDVEYTKKLYQPQTKDELEKLVYNSEVYLGQIDTSKITDMSNLFNTDRAGHADPKRIVEDFSGIEKWDVSRVKNMSDMFRGQKNIGYYNLSDWDVSQVENMTEMFAFTKTTVNGSDSQENVNDWHCNIAGWDVLKVKSCSKMFESSNINEDLSGWDLNPDLNKNTKDIFKSSPLEDKYDLMPLKVKNFITRVKFNELKDLIDELDKKILELSKEKEEMVKLKENLPGQFYRPKTKDELVELVNNPEINLKNIDTSLITDMSNLFRISSERGVVEFFDIPNLRKDFSGLEDWDVSNVTRMDGMFAGQVYIGTADLSKWDVSKVTTMAEMFAHTDSHELWEEYHVELEDTPDPAICNIGNWDVSNVENFDRMFIKSDLDEDLTYWNMKKYLDGLCFGGVDSIHDILCDVFSNSHIDKNKAYPDDFLKKINECSDYVKNEKEEIEKQSTGRGR